MCQNCCKVFCDNRNEKQYCEEKITFVQANQLEQVSLGEATNDKRRIKSI